MSVCDIGVGDEWELLYCFNPCFNGCRSAILPGSPLIKSPIIYVSILVLMDVGLRYPEPINESLNTSLFQSLF